MVSKAFLVVLALAVAGCGSGGGGDDDDMQIVDDAGQVTVSRVVNYIRAAPFPKLVIEVDSVAGFEPRAANETALGQGIQGLLAKPGGVTVMRDKALTSKGTDHAWTFGELDSLAGSTFDLTLAADTIAMHVMFVDGHSADDTSSGKILGIAWGQRHVVMFKQTIESLCDGAGLPLLRDRLCASAELSVWTHEIGHLLGLVDNGLAMATDHKDPDSAHGAHDRNSECVMYWAYEGQGVFDVLKTRFIGGNENALGFDSQCLADINAAK